MIQTGSLVEITGSAISKLIWKVGKVIYIYHSGICEIEFDFLVNDQQYGYEYTGKQGYCRVFAEDLLRVVGVPIQIKILQALTKNLYKVLHCDTQLYFKKSDTEESLEIGACVEVSGFISGSKLKGVIVG